MKNIKILFIFISIFSTINLNAQTEIELIAKTLADYFEGTANGEPERIKSAFHKDLKLYHVENDSLVAWSGKKYISHFKQGKKSNRIGKIISIDFENDAGIAKVEVDIPDLKRIYTDYFLLLKIEGKWKIVHKAFTFRVYPE